MPGYESLWQPPPSDPATLPWTLGREDVHVWLAALNLAPVATAHLSTLLSADEQGRARRFLFDREREHYIAARGTLRSLLCAYLDIPPADIAFAYGLHGKPSLAPTHSTSNLRFNASHSRDYALYAFTSGRDIGVDIEYMRPLSDANLIAEHFFSPGERATLRSLPAHLQHAAFYAAWTRKEAYIKAIGKGLAQPIDEFDVSLAPGTPAQLLHVANHPDEVQRWHMRALPAPTGYAAALTVEGADTRLTLRRWHTATFR